jgi:hypothetical protein
MAVPVTAYNLNLRLMRLPSREIIHVLIKTSAQEISGAAEQPGIISISSPKQTPRTSHPIVDHREESCAVLMKRRKTTKSVELIKRHLENPEDCCATEHITLSRCLFLRFQSSLEMEARIPRSYGLLYQYGAGLQFSQPHVGPHGSLP